MELNQWRYQCQQSQLVITRNWEFLYFVVLFRFYCHIHNSRIQTGIPLYLQQIKSKIAQIVKKYIYIERRKLICHISTILFTYSFLSISLPLKCTFWRNFHPYLFSGKPNRNLQLYLFEKGIKIKSDQIKI